MKATSPTKEYLQLRSASLYPVSPWFESAWRRGFDLVGAALLLIALLPVILVVALGVRFTSKGSILFRQRRPGKNGHEFLVLKFRTMVDSEQQAGPLLTRASDPRVTRFGRYLRRWKLDELPQLINVLRGQMSFVGPRPQPTPLWAEPSIQKEASYVLSVRPGMTGEATLSFCNEEEILAPLSAEEVEEIYKKTLMPLKLKMDLDYLRRASFSSDLRIIFRTVFRICNRRGEANDLLIRKSLPVIEK